MTAPDEAAESEVTLTVNGRAKTIRIRNDDPLIRTLRRDFAITSVRGACGIGVCGTCTVLVDGKVASSCIMLTRQAAGRDITTSDGLIGDAGKLSDIQEAFVRRGAYQCSFCIPAMVLAVHGALSEEPDRSPEEVREYLGGNLCRCGTYPQVLEAVADVIAQRQTADGDGP